MFMAVLRTLAVGSVRRSSKARFGTILASCVACGHRPNTLATEPDGNPADRSPQHRCGHSRSDPAAGTLFDLAVGPPAYVGGATEKH